MEEEDDLEYHLALPSPVYSQASSRVGLSRQTTRSSSPRDPLIILLGWAGCEDKHLAKYSEIYEDRRCLTLRYTLPTEDIFFYPWRIELVAQKLVSVIHEISLNEHPIVFHTFSNGGTFLYRAITYLLAGRSCDGGGRSRDDSGRSRDDSGRSCDDSGPSRDDSGRSRDDSGRSCDNSGRSCDDSGPSRDDSGRSREDSGRSCDDSGPLRDDSGRSREDSGRSRDDSGRSRDDSGRSREDSGRSRDDSGRSREDSGRSRDDSGRSRDDSGRSRDDSGRSRDDSGRSREDSGRSREDSGPPSNDTLDIRGVIFDSAPGKGSYRGLFLALYGTSQGPWWWRMAKSLFYTSLIVAGDVWGRLCDVFTWDEDVMDSPRRTYWTHMKTDPTRYPQLYLYSQADNICQAADVEEMMEARERMGVEIRSKRWIDSPHCYHLPAHRDEYVEEVNTFLDVVLHGADTS